MGWWTQVHGLKKSSLSSLIAKEENLSFLSTMVSALLNRNMLLVIGGKFQGRERECLVNFKKGGA